MTASSMSRQEIGGSPIKGRARWKSEDLLGRPREPPVIGRPNGQVVVNEHLLCDLVVCSPGVVAEKDSFKGILGIRLCNLSWARWEGVPVMKIGFVGKVWALPDSKVEGWKVPESVHGDVPWHGEGKLLRNAWPQRSISRNSRSRMSSIRRPSLKAS